MSRPKAKSQKLVHCGFGEASDHTATAPKASARAMYEYGLYLTIVNVAWSSPKSTLPRNEGEMRRKRLAIPNIDIARSMRLNR